MLSAAVSPESRRLGPLSVRALSTQEAIDEIVDASACRRPLRIAFANTHLLYCTLQDQRLAALLSGFLVVNDGIGLEFMSRIACGRGFPENLNGTDLMPRIMHGLAPGTTVYLLGARTEVVSDAAAIARSRWPHLNIAAARDGYRNVAAATLELAWLKPDVVLVAMGNPRQEHVIAHCAAQCGAGVFLGVGAFFDFLAGAAPRAPHLWRQLRLEWLFRLTREPARLWRRYTVEIAVVLASLWRQRYRRSA